MPESQTFLEPTPVPIFQHHDEFSQLLNIYIERQPLTILELGTYHGGTLYHWLRNAPRGATIVSIDSYAVGVDNRQLYPAWTPRGVICVPICGNTHGDGMSAAAEHGPFEFVFIDAGHFDHEVRADWAAARSVADDEALIAFHDILPPTFAHPEIEVCYLWAELKAQYRTEEIIDNPHADWGGIGVVWV